MAAAGGSRSSSSLGLCCHPNRSGHHQFFFCSHLPRSSALFCPPFTITISLIIRNKFTLLPSNFLTCSALPSSSASSSGSRPHTAADRSTKITSQEERNAARVEQLWQQFFSDTSQWWDRRLDKGNPEAPDFEHKTSEKALWIKDRFSPSWLQAKLATLTQQAPQQLSSSSSSSTCRISSGQALRTRQLWEEFFSDPSQWWDNRTDDKKISRFPDFEHKTEKKALWIDSRLNPPWVHARLAVMIQCQEHGRSGSSTPEISGRVVRMEQLWQEFFSDPSQWWDNRFIKTSPKYPDFKHKSTHEGLWIEGRLNPIWVKAKMATMTLGHIHSGGELRSWVFDSCGNGGKVSKLCQEGRLKEALHMVELMVEQDTLVPIIAYVGLLKGCARRKALAEGKQVHALLVQSGHDSVTFLGNTLVDMYAKCGSVLDARNVFNTMPEHNVISWTAIISAYADNGQGEEAINLFQQMRLAGIAADKILFVIVLKACARISDLEQGKQLHSQIVKSGFEADMIVGNSLVNMYAKCGSIEHARQVFSNMCERDVLSWNALIAGYAQEGLCKDALALYERMKQEDMQPNSVTYVILLKACASIAALEQGKHIHSHIVNSGFELDVIVSSALVDMYAKCGCIEHARQVFNNMHERDVVSWNAMIAGYAQQGLGKEVFELYEQMKLEDVQPTHVTYVVLLKACASIASLEDGKRLHSQIVEIGFESDVIIGNTLVDMYAKCGSIEHARHVFSNMHERDIVSWNALIAGYAQQGLVKEALALYEQMKQEDVQPDDVTYVVLLNACAGIAALEQGQQLHSHVITSGFDSDIIVGSALVDMYTKCGSIEHARRVFNNMYERDIVSWTAMIAGYAEEGLGKEALELYEQMKQEDVLPNNVTYVVLLKACARITCLERGQQLHFQIIESGFQSDEMVGGALIDMYAKCGSIEDARHVFNNLPERDLVSWNTMITGYAQQGLGEEAVRLLEQMQREGKKPNRVTYVSVLSACSHSGLVDEGRRLFDFMFKNHGVTPTVDHYACMVDLLCRAGCLAEAEDLINKMPIQPDAVVWRTLLGAARNHGHVEIGRRAFDCIVKLEPENPSAYVLLSDIYAAAGRRDELANIRKEMIKVGVNNTLGCRWNLDDNQVHAFAVEHPKQETVGWIG